MLEPFDPRSSRRFLPAAYAHAWRVIRCSTIALIVVALAAPVSAGAQELPVIPRPRSAEHAGEAWRPTADVALTTGGARARELTGVAAFAAEVLRDGLGVRSTVRPAARAARGGVHLELAEAPTGMGRPWHRMTVDASGVRIVADSPEAAFHAVQSLRQLIAGSGPGTVMGARIEDAPRFAWRGLHLDVARHFQPVTFIKRQLDLMARYKLNVFHWHLTEDQGWRIEIARYPRLTEIGSCRAETMVARNFDPYVGDGTPHCGFYTQAEIREVVAYAAERFITVVPEIEMPGHTVAALAAYPELACTPGPFAVRTTWGVDDNILCPSERTFEFLEGVLTEVLALFPSTFIHIGGDEAPKVRWKESALAQEVIRREGLRDEHELQSWFIRRIERFLNAQGRRLIGWDEILEGGLAPNASVMSWRGVSGGIEAAKAGHDVVMTPTSHMYFDYYQGDPRFEPLAIGGLVPLEQVYAYEPIPEELSADEARHVLGAQGNLWTEYLPSADHVDYMTWPRALALAEVTWSARERRDWESFSVRLPYVLRTLSALRVNYRLPHVAGLERDVLTLAPEVTVRLGSPLPDAAVHYTLDGSDPTPESPRYAGPFALPLTADGVRVTARAFTSAGVASPLRAATFTRTTYRDGEGIEVGRLERGVRMEYFEADLRRVAPIDTMAALRTRIVTTLARQGDERAERYALRFTGLLRVPEDAMYEFALTSDDGSSLAIGDRVVVDNDGLHGAEERTGMMALRAGAHPFVLRFFQAGGGAALSLRFRVGDASWAPVPADWLTHLP